MLQPLLLMVEGLFDFFFTKKSIICEYSIVHKTINCNKKMDLLPRNIILIKKKKRGEEKKRIGKQLLL